MAIIKPGPMIAEARGGVGGLIFSRNKGGQYVKNFAAPTNPQTTRQTDVRADFATLVSDWGNRLTGTERLAWNDFAELNPVLNSLGDSIFLTGMNWFVKTNAKLLQAALTVVDDPPPVGSLPPPDTAFAVSDIDASLANFDIDFDAAGLWVDIDGAAMLVYAGKPQSNGVEAFGIPYRFAGVILGNSTTPPTSPATISFPYSGLSTGNQFTAKATIILPSGAQIENMQSPYLPG